MHLTHNIYFANMIWNYQEQTFTPIESGARPIPNHALQEEYRKAEAIAETLNITGNTSIETMLYLEVSDIHSNLSVLLDQSQATICICPA